MKTNYSIYSILIPFLFIYQPSKGQEYWGMTLRGGEYDKGVIFKLDKDAGNQEIVFSFEAMGFPGGGMTEYSDSIFYGTTVKNMGSGIGGIFRFNSQKGQFTKILDFDSYVNGADGAGTLLLASNKKLYGTLKTGGAFDHGVIYELDPETTQLSIKFDFNAPESGMSPIGKLVEGADGNLYGITSEGGNEDSGVIFSFNYNTGVFTKLFDLQAETMGSQPEGGLILAADNNLYGTTSRGGKNNSGVIFRVNPVTVSYEILFTFDGMDHGSYPACTLLEGSNGNLYGTTASGGSIGYGLIFEFDYKNKIFIKRLENRGPYSDKIVGSLVEAPNKKLYAMSFYSDSHGVRMYEIDTEEGVFVDYLLSAGEMRYGENCLESITVAADGRLFLWGWDSFYVDQELFLFEFDSELGEVVRYYMNQTFHTGSYPTGELVHAENGNLYGIGKRGGLKDSGVIFEFNPLTQDYSKVVDFDMEQKGAIPVGSPVITGDSVIYGMTNKGGLNDKGVIYEYRTNSGIFTKLLDFDGEEKGEHPEGSLMLADNGTLYGMTTYGGTHGNGVIFSFETESNTYLKLFDFEASATGRNPVGSLFQASNGKIYGTTPVGNKNNYGVFFEFNVETNQLHVIKDDVMFPFEIMQASNGKLYISGSSNAYEFDPVEDHFRGLNLPSVDGRIGKLFEYMPNKLLGMNYGELWYLGGPNTDGDIFEYDLESDLGRIIVEFDGSNGRHPDNSSFKKVDQLTGPIAVCRPVNLYLDEEGNAVLRPEDIDNGSMGNGIRLSIDKTRFSCDGVGEHTVTLNVTDDKGDSSSCKVIVTVLDTIPPEVKTQDIIVYLDSTGMVPIQPEDIDAGSFDVCGINDISLSIDAFSCADLGENLVEMEVSDINGNISKSMAVVTVIDTISPEIVCPADLVQFLPQYQNNLKLQENEWKAVADDNCLLEAPDYLFIGNKPSGISPQGELSIRAGIYDIEWNAIDLSGNVSNCTSKIVVNKRPTSIIVLNESMELIQGKIVVEAILLDSLLDEGIKDMAVEVITGNFSEAFQSNGRGTIKIELPINAVSSSPIDLSVQFSGNDTYLGCEVETELVTGVHFVTDAELKVFPNPFNERVYFEFVAPVTADARLDLYDATGKLLKTLFNHPVSAGGHYFTEFKPQNESSGLFIYRLLIGNQISTGKINYQR